MNPISFNLGKLEIKTCGKGFENRKSNQNDFYFTSNLSEKVSFNSSDEVSVIFFDQKRGIKGFIKVDLDESLNGLFEEKLKKAIANYSIDLEETLIFVGPLLTFAHCEINEDTVLSLLNKGYDLAVKGVLGVRYCDHQMITFTVLKKYGAKIENTYFSDYDTFEYKNLLYSKLRGDSESNLTEF